tara:strand:- start:281 stop:1465 length:1185 start_codon:yes stop_codon:yes gene_type:complete
MHILESYALQNDLKIDKPLIYEKYFPLTIDKFITLDTSSLGTKALNYDHWQLVVDLIYPKLKELDIYIVQLGEKTDQLLQNCYSTMGQCNFNQKAYVISKGLAHVSTNNESCHIASHYNKKSVVVFSNNCYTGQFKPYWTDEDKVCIVEPPKGSVRPSYNPNEEPKSINTIAPEEIASKILALVGVHTFSPELKTVKIGKSFYNSRIDSDLTHLLDANKLKVASLIVRMDFNFNEANLVKQLEACPCSVITSKPISDEILNKYHKKIVELVYYIEDDHSPEFIRKIKQKSINYLLRTRKEGKEINDLKLDYFDYGLIQPIKAKSRDDFEELKGKNKLFYKSNYFIVHGNKFYPSTAAFLNKEQGSPNMKHEIHPVIDIPLFWEEEEHFQFLAKK